MKNADGTTDGGVHALFTIAGRTDAAGCTLAQPDFAAHAVPEQRDLPHSHAGLRRGLDRADSRRGDPRQPGRATPRSKQPLGIGGTAELLGCRTRRHRAGEQQRQRRHRSRASAGRRRTSRCCSSPARPTTWRWASPTSSSPPSATNADMPVRAQCPTTSPNTDGTDDSAAMLGDREVRDLPALPRAARAFHRHARRRAVDQQRQQPLRRDGLRALPHAHVADGQLDRRGASLPDGEPLFRPADARHGSGARRRGRARTGRARASSARAPLWGLGQRVFFLHDGRTSDLIQAIQAHQSGTARNGNASEANGVVNHFNSLSEPQKQDLLNFLRSL